LENVHLGRAACIVGLKLPSRKVVADALLHIIFEEPVTLSTDRIASMVNPSGADGWRQKLCEHDAGLMNSIVNGNREALLYDVKNCSETRNNAQRHRVEVGCEIMGGKQLAPIFTGLTL
jgi:hypothetical protein